MAVLLWPGRASDAPPAPAVIDIASALAEAARCAIGVVGLPAARGVRGPTGAIAKIHAAL